MITTLPEVLDSRGAGAAGRPDGFEADVFAAELDALRGEVLADLGTRDAEYIRRLIKLQRRLELAGRAALVAGKRHPMWLLGTSLLSLSKILENMEIGHNVMHGQWDWMQDPLIHSTAWEWDNVCPSSQWKHTHNHVHHQWTNVRGMDADIGYGVFRVDDEQPWTPGTRWQPLAFVGLATIFEYGVGFHDARHSPATASASPLPPSGPVTPDSPDSGRVDSDPVGSGSDEEARIVARQRVHETIAKIRRQAVKDFVAWPAASIPFGPAAVLSSLTGSVAANIVRNWWSFAVIFCGHFPDGVQFLDAEDVEGETRGDWYRRQVVGSVNFTGGPILDVMSGNLDHQIEHHLFPDIPANRYAEIAPRVRSICDRHDVPYNTASMAKQFGSVIRRIWRLAFQRG
ncbi:MAG: fatty acid desaturase family protein [Microthrixaceae bacterium]